ncbi:MAG: FAD-dependent oxidoreductase, partial [Desulfovibrio sp.]|nr:FAD-dependent oxidoreductase [Desulfovibrio sp.]
VRELNEWYRNELSRLPVDIHLGQEARPEIIVRLEPDVIILAAGSEPVELAAGEAQNGKIVGCIEALANPDRIGQKVVVIGGGLVGCEMALEYAQNGKDVTVVEALPHILAAGIPSPVPNAQMIPDLFEKYGVKVLENHKFVGFSAGRAHFENADGPVALDADTIVTATGFRPCPSMKAELEKFGFAVHEIGDQRSVATILQAIWDGFEVGNNI